MAALVRARHSVLKLPLFTARNTFATKAEKRKGIDRKVGPKIDSTVESLAAKGFLRAQKSYTPPADTTNKLDEICQKILGTTDENITLKELDRKYELFLECSQVFNHSIPNSQLHEIQTLKDVYEFYAKPVETVTPLDKLKTMDLPKNLHIQYEYHRFHPDTDTKFGGITAFPESSTIVSGIKYKGKYKGHQQIIKHPEL